MSSTDWLYDFLMQMFRSPSWEVPIMNWIDENCIIFDNEEENKLEYTTKHNEFCSLIEELLESHLTEIGLSSEDFATVCAMAGPNSVLQGAIFEQILAVDDFLTFKKLMSKRNAELELDAIKELAKASIPLPSSLSSSTSTTSSTTNRPTENKNSSTTHISSPSSASATEPIPSSSSTEYVDSSVVVEDKEFETAIAESMLDVEYATRQTEFEIAQIEAAIAASLALEEERLRLIKEKEEQDKEEEQAIALSLQTITLKNSNSVYPVNDTVRSKSTSSPAQSLSSPITGNERTFTSTSSTKTNNALPSVSSSSRLTSSLQDLPSLPGMNTTTSSSASSSSSTTTTASILDTVLNFTSLSSSSSSSSLSSLPPIQGNPHRNHPNSLPSLGSPSKSAALSPTYSDELDAALLGNYSSSSSSANHSGTDDFIDSSLLPLGVRRAENYLEESKARLQSLKQKGAKRDSEFSPAELASRQSHLREVRDALRAKNRADREKALAEAETVNTTTKNSTERNNVRSKVGEAMNSIRATFETTNGDSNGNNNNGEEEELSEEDKRKLMRLALAQKIKTDVIAATSGSSAK